ncbi:hypothetical protein LWI28_028733 [Acer negundo]|uniref:phosphoribosyl-ATP diphosphatase n=1 Tax=Acer negundo TaxID=4023 RepID=A0AAD5IK12_ACENE|nr:hypothetical protein LWI28_028733 [Acer negundo]
MIGSDHSLVIDRHCYCFSAFPDSISTWLGPLPLNKPLYGREKADELCRTPEENEDKSRIASEMADVMYHAIVLLDTQKCKNRGGPRSSPAEIFNVRHRGKEKSQCTKLSHHGIFT